MEGTRTLSVLGSTGSIGVNALNVVRSFPDHFTIKYLSAQSQSDLLIEQAREFNPQAVVIGDESRFNDVQQALPGTEVLAGRAGLLELAGRDDIDIMLNGIVGSVT